MLPIERSRTRVVRSVRGFWVVATKSLVAKILVKWTDHIRDSKSQLLEVRGTIPTGEGLMALSPDFSIATSSSSSPSRWAMK